MSNYPKTIDITRTPEYQANLAKIRIAGLDVRICALEGQKALLKVERAVAAARSLGGK